MITIGYSSQRKALRVGDCCKSMVAETAETVRWNYRGYDVPPWTATLWRYMDFAKFVAMLKEGALHFSRLDEMGDRFELAKGLRERKDLWDAYHLEEYRKMLRNPPPGLHWEMTDGEIERQARKLLLESDNFGPQQKREIYVSCWHENETESEALWRLYTGGSPGVAVRIWFGRLLTTLRDYPDIAVGRVEYVDFNREFAGINEAVFRKRKSLSHEREVRAVHYFFADDPQLGINISIDLANLIDKVVVSPFAPAWFAPVVKETAARYGYTLDVQQSELLQEPFF